LVVSLLRPLEAVLWLFPVWGIGRMEPSEVDVKPFSEGSTFEGALTFQPRPTTRKVMATMGVFAAGLYQGDEGSAILGWKLVAFGLASRKPVGED
jgi:hypothetical protein